MSARLVRVRARVRVRIRARVRVRARARVRVRARVGARVRLGGRDVVVDSDDQVGAERQALPEGVGVAVVEEVEGAVHEDPDLLPPDRQGRARRPLQLSTKRHDLRLRLCELGSHQLRLRLLPAAVCDVVDGQRGREQC